MATKRYDTTKLDSASQSMSSLGNQYQQILGAAAIPNLGGEFETPSDAIDEYDRRSEKVITDQVQHLMDLSAALAAFAQNYEAQDQDAASALNDGGCNQQGGEPTPTPSPGHVPTPSSTHDGPRGSLADTH